MAKKMILIDEMLRKYTTIKDNDLCLCGSGKMFSECHKIYKEKAEENPYSIYKRTRKIKKDKRCYYESRECNSINTYSHSIPKQSLQSIAEDGHVFHFDLIEPNQSLEMLESYSVEPKKIGINEVGCYYGFCGYHDTEVFKEIEISKIIPNHEQITLTRLRALTNELYVKTQSLKLIPILNDITASKESKEAQEILGTYSAQFYLGSYKAIDEFTRDLKVLKNDITSNLYEKYSSIVYILDKDFPIQCCGYINPIFSIKGEIIQDLNNLSKESEFFSLNCFYKDNNTYVVFVWKKKHILDDFFREFQEIPNEDIPNFILQFILAYSENHAIKPSWWNSLSIIKKKRLMKIFYEDIIDHQDLQNPINNFRKLKFTSSTLNKVIYLNVN